MNVWQKFFSTGWTRIQMHQFSINNIIPDVLTVGLDEAGRGPLAGAVVAAAVILPLHCSLSKLGLNKLNDSKKLSEKTRLELFPLIKKNSVAWSIAWADCEEVDAINILQASLLAMRRSLLGLRINAQQILVDGNKLPTLPSSWESTPAHAIIKGDSLVPAISAASVLAKVTRDKMLYKLHENYPEYGFAQHKGYPTKAHLAMLTEYGPCPVHRHSYAPVKNCCV